MKPGDKLYFVDRYKKRDQLLTIEGVGRRWVRFAGADRWKMDKQTMVVVRADATEWEVGQCYESKQAYEDSIAMAKELFELKRFVARLNTADLSREAIRKAAEVLGMEWET